MGLIPTKMYINQVDTVCYGQIFFALQAPAQAVSGQGQAVSFGFGPA